MVNLQQFLGALRSGDIKQANMLYSSMSGNSTEQQKEVVDDSPTATTDTPSNAKPDLAASAPASNTKTPDVAAMDAAATLPNKAILEELKSVRDMIRAAKQENKINDPATLKAIAAKHKALLSVLIDDATE